MKRIATLTILALLLLSTTGAVVAQTVSGSITGQVRERTSGDALPGVTVTVRSDALVSGYRVAVTDEGGNYRFPSLPPGVYSVETDLSGFAPMRQEDIRVSIGQTITVDLAIGMAQLAEEITVLADAPRVDVTSSAVSSTIGKEEIESLPLPRNANALFDYTRASTTAGPTVERSTHRTPTTSTA